MRNFDIHVPKTLGERAFSEKSRLSYNANICANHSASLSKKIKLMHVH